MFIPHIFSYGELLWSWFSFPAMFFFSVDLRNAKDCSKNLKKTNFSKFGFLIREMSILISCHMNKLGLTVQKIDFGKILVFA